MNSIKDGNSTNNLCHRRHKNLLRRLAPSLEGIHALSEFDPYSDSNLEEVTKETMNDSYLLDRLGEKYNVDLDEDGISLDAFIIWGHSGIGRIQCVVDEEANVLVIGNIELFEHPLLPRNGLFSFRPFQRPKRNFRGRGLGSAMLKYVIAQAEQLGVVGISGFITPDDASTTPYLLEWYEKHGFIVKKTSNEANRLATIYRRV